MQLERLSSAVNFPNFSPPSPIYRIGRAGEVWDWPDWLRADNRRTFGNRFDDCSGIYRVLYAGTTRYACYLETLARFRPSGTFYEALKEIDGDVDHVAPYLVDPAWHKTRRVGTAKVTGRHADIAHSIWLSAFYKNLATEARVAAIDTIDQAALYVTAPRSFTQSVSRMVYDNTLDGVRYLSKHGNDAECWAMFELRVKIFDEHEHTIELNDPDLKAAMLLFGLDFA